MDSAHTALPPTLIWVRVTPASAPDVVTATGMSLAAVPPLPSCPPLPAPQQ